MAELDKTFSTYLGSQRSCPGEERDAWVQALKGAIMRGSECALPQDITPNRDDKTVMGLANFIALNSSQESKRNIRVLLNNRSFALVLAHGVEGGQKKLLCAGVTVLCVDTDEAFGGIAQALSQMAIEHCSEPVVHASRRAMAEPA